MLFRKGARHQSKGLTGPDWNCLGKASSPLQVDRRHPVADRRQVTAATEPPGLGDAHKYGLRRLGVDAGELLSHVAEVPIALVLPVHGLHQLDRRLEVDLGQLLREGRARVSRPFLRRQIGGDDESLVEHFGSDLALAHVEQGFGDHSQDDQPVGRVPHRPRLGARQGQELQLPIARVLGQGASNVDQADGRPKIVLDRFDDGEGLLGGVGRDRPRGFAPDEVARVGALNRLQQAERTCGVDPGAALHGSRVVGLPLGLRGQRDLALGQAHGQLELACPVQAGLASPQRVGRILALADDPLQGRARVEVAAVEANSLGFGKDESAREDALEDEAPIDARLRFHEARCVTLDKDTRPDHRLAVGVDETTFQSSEPRELDLDALADLRARKPVGPQHLRPGRRGDIYFESLSGSLVYGWAPLRGVRSGRWKLIDSGESAELFDLRGDPDETENLETLEAQRLADLRAVLAEFENTDGEDGSTPAPAPLDAETQALMASLGYASGMSGGSLEGAPHPREMIHMEAELLALQGHMVRGDWEQVVNVCAYTLKLDPRNKSALVSITQALTNLGRLDDAEANAKLMRKFYPDVPEGYPGLAQVYVAQERPAKAYEVMSEGLAAFPDAERMRYLWLVAAFEADRPEVCTESVPGATVEFADSGRVLMMRARCEARAGQLEAALATLHDVVDLGFRALKGIEQTDDFAKVAELPGFAVLMATLDGPPPTSDAGDSSGAE